MESNIPKDCINTQSNFGRNLTPLPIIYSVQEVFDDFIELDPCSDEVANKEIQAQTFYSLEDDGFSKEWEAKTVWLNPPGKTVSQGKKTFSVDWYRKLYNHWYNYDIIHAIALVYGVGRIGGLDKSILEDAVICLTCRTSEAKIINNSGRMNFDLVENNIRVPTTANTQSSAILLFSNDIPTRRKFIEEFSQYGAILTA